MLKPQKAGQNRQNPVYLYLAGQRWRCLANIAPRRRKAGRKVRPILYILGPKVFVMKVKPLLDRVLIKTEDAEETTKSGIVLAAKSQEKPQIARVIAVGPGGEIDGKEIKMYLKEGDRVISAKYSGTEVKIDGEEYTIVKQSDILAVVE